MEARNRRPLVELLENRCLLSATLVKDINLTSTGPANPQSLFSLNGAALFSAGDKLWRSDGTAAGTAIVKDLGTANGQFDVKQTLVVGNVAYLAGDLGIWRTDGTTVGTTFIDAGNPKNLAAVGNTVYFSAHDNTHTNGQELWKSDGTQAGTMLVKDINPGAGGSNPFSIIPVGNKFFFAAAVNSVNFDLWISDGTTNGTVKFAPPALASGVELNKDTPIGLGLGGKFYFSAFTQSTGDITLWVTDGTAAGTHNILSGGLRYPYDFTVFNNRVFVTASPPATNANYQLFSTDGTDAGTALVQSDSNPYGLSAHNAVAASNQLFFAGQDGAHGVELWRSDGTTAGTKLVKDINHNLLLGATGDPASSSPEDIVTIGNTAYFTADDGAHGIELWRSDGTQAGTTLVKDINPSSTSNPLIAPQELTPVGSKVFFTADDGVNGRQLWVSDGTTAGTTLVKTISVKNSSALSSQIDPVSGNLTRATVPVVYHGFTLFSADDGVNGLELWRSDGTPQGTVMVKDINPGASGSRLSNMTIMGDVVYFTATEDNSSMGLWRTDGTANGTQFIKTVGPVYSVFSDNEAIQPGNLTVIGATLYFTAGTDLWLSDGTSAGTKILANNVSTVPLSPDDKDDPRYLTAVGNHLFFNVAQGATGRELWVTDGTPAGTMLVKDIVVGPTGLEPTHLTNVNGKLFFEAIGQLWISDGTPAGTTPIRAFPDLLGARNFVAIGSRLFFTVDDGVHGEELWTSDGTSIGTTVVKDINVGAPGSSPRNLTNVDGTLFFAAFDANHLWRVWRSDGTDTGTYPIAAVEPDNLKLQDTIPPFDFTRISGEIFFVDSDGTHGVELWATDGTPSGTVLIEDIAPGAADSIPSNLVNLNGTLLFNADDGIHGRELWKVVSVPTSSVTSPPPLPMTPPLPGDPPPPPPRPPLVPGAPAATTTDIQIVSITATPTSATVDSPLTYTITVKNNGPAAVTGATVVVDPLPLSVVLQSVDFTQGSFVTDAGTDRFLIGSLAPGQNAVATIVTIPTKTGDLTIHAHVSADQQDTNAANNDASLTTSVHLPAITGTGADLAIASLTAQTGTVRNGGPVVEVAGDVFYKIVVANLGDSRATNVVLDVTLPAGATVFYGDADTPPIFFGGVLFPGPPAQVGNHFFFSLLDLAPGTSRVAIFDLVQNTVGNAHLMATVSGDQTDIAPNNNTATSDVLVLAAPPASPTAIDLELSSYVAAPDPVQSQHQVTQTVVVKNLSTTNTATNVKVGADENPSFTTFVSTTAPGGFTRSGDFVSLLVGTLAPGESKTFTFTEVILLDGLARRLLFSGVVVTGDQPDPNGFNDIVRQQLQVLPAPADLEVQTTAPAAIAIGDDLTYTVTVTNRGDSTALNPKLRHTLPAPQDGSFVAASASRGTFDVTDGIITFAPGDLPANATATFTVTIHTHRTGKLFTASFVNSNTFDPDISNNSSFTSVTVVPQGSPVLLDKPDLEISTLTANPDPVTVGSNLTYTVIIRNRGGITATDVHLRDLLPDSVNFLSATTSQGRVSTSGASLDVDLGSLASEASATITIVVMPTLVGSVRNEVGVAMKEVDPFPSDNRASITTSVLPVPAPVTGADLVVSNVGAPDPATEGSILTYTLKVVNNGPDAAGSVVLTDVLPTDAIYLSGDAAQGSLHFDSASHTVIFNLGTLLNGQSATATIQVSAARRGFFLNKATVSAATTDPNPANNLALEQIPVLGPGDNCASLVADLNLTSASAFGDPVGGATSPDAIVMDGIAYFTANDGIRGAELWRSDGTDSGTYLVKDISPNGSSSPGLFKVVNHKLYFDANDGTSDRLWVSDGTAAGTQPVPAFGSAGSTGKRVLDSIGTTTIFSSFLNFATVELWKQGPGDPSPVMYKSIPYSTGSTFSTLTANGVIYLMLDHGASGRELWRSDGTDAGTFKIKTFGTASSNLLFYNSQLFALGATIYVADPDSTGTAVDELWATDGTAGNTTLLHHFGGRVTEMTAFGGNLYFFARDASLNAGLWTSNGTVAGTVAVHSFINDQVNNYYPRDMNVLNGSLSFFVQDGGQQAGNPVGLELWTSNGAAAGTVLVKNLGVDPESGDSFTNFIPTVLGNLVYFAFTDGANGIELFTTDGTAAGTRKLIDLNPNGGANPGFPIIVGNRLFFQANDGVHGFEMWQTDGTALGTTLIKDIALGTNDANPAYLGILGGKALVLAQISDNNLGLASTDGTTSGTTVIKNLHSQPIDRRTLNITGAPTSSAIVGNKLFFTAGSKLWVTDGTSAGTTLVRDFTNEPLGKQPFRIEATSSRIFFVTQNDTSGSAIDTIWTSDGIQTTALETAGPAADFLGSDLETLTVVGDTAFFGTNHSTPLGALVGQLWKSDGTVAGTQPIAAFNGFGGFASYNGALYFVGKATGVGSGLWRSDGTSGGTVLVVRDFSSANAVHDIADFISTVVAINGKLYLENDGPFHANSTAGAAILWVSDGTRAGTTQLATIRPANPATFLHDVKFQTNFAVLGNRVYFIVEDISNLSNYTVAAQLWVTDNTTVGTQKVANIPLGGDRIMVAGNHLFFTATGPNGSLWQSDGTNTVSAAPDVGTEVVPNTKNPGTELNGIDLNGVLLFTNDDGFHGAELWKVACPTVNADLEVTQSANPSPAVVVGETVTYTLNVVNHGPDAADAILTDTLPDGVTIVGASASQGRFTKNGNSYTFHLGNLIAGAQAIVTIQTVTNTTGTLTNTAHVFSAVNDPQQANNVATTTVNVTQTALADLTVDVTGTPTITHAGTPVTLTFDVTNHGPNIATGAILTATLPAGFTLSNAPGLQPVTSSGNTLHFQLDPLASGGMASVTLVLTPRTAGTFTTTASVTGNETDTNPTDNSAQTKTIITASELLLDTTSTTHHTTTLRNNLPNAQTYQTHVVGVLSTGKQVVFDMTTNYAPTSAQVNALFSQAAAALRAAGAVNVGPAALSASSSTTSASVLVNEATLPPGVTVTITQSSGPATVLVGADRSQSIAIPRGGIGFNTNTATETFLQDTYQATTNHVATYTILGSPLQGQPKIYTVTDNATTFISAAVGLLNQPTLAGTRIHLVTDSITSLPQGFALRANADGSFFVTPKMGFFGQVQFTYEISDGEQTSTPITVTLIVARRGRQWSR